MFIMSKICVVCGKEFDPENTRRIFCSEECKRKNDYVKYVKPACDRFREKHPEKMKEAQEKYNQSHPHRFRLMKQEWRLKTLKYISNSEELKCSNPNCLVPGGCDTSRVLQIDHVNGGGRKETKEIGGGKHHDYQMRYWKHILALPQEEARQRYQILCANCNTMKLFDETEALSKN